MTNPPSSGGGLTLLGKLFSVLLVLGLVGLGAWMLFKPGGKGPFGGNGGTSGPGPASQTAQTGGAGGTGVGAGGADAASTTKFDTSDLSDTRTEVPRLPAALAYVPKDDTIDVELSGYAGYAGLIAANGGLEPNADSVFAKKYGFKVRIKISEDESWPALNTGRMAASATTADVLAVYGRQFQVVVPAQIAYSRGADGLVVRSDIKRVNDLKGKVVAAAQFTESDFFIRYLAREAGIPVKALPDLAATPDAESINLVYTSSGDKAGDVFAKALKAGSSALAGCVTWAPKTTQIPAESNGKAKLLVTNKNLLVIADVLVVNRGFAEKNPDKVAGLVDGLLAGNKAVRENPEANADVIGKAFKWDRTQTLAELQKVHLSNLPENGAFFAGGITQGGSFASIYQSAVLSYGAELVPNPVDSDYFVSADALKKAEASGAYKDQVAAIVPLQSSTAGRIEADPLLSRDIRFYFEPMSAKLDTGDKNNLDNLTAIKRMLDVSPGSRVLLVGHVDDSNKANLRKQGGEDLVRRMALEAMDLSKQRATEIRRQLIDRQKVEAKRIETVGRGWEQPVGTNPDLNRRVEVQWFTLE
jgi:NitT/TauT family transport system substrate-binding protein